jgi:hypothetical protein
MMDIKFFMLGWILCILFKNLVKLRTILTNLIDLGAGAVVAVFLLSTKYFHL